MGSDYIGVDINNTSRSLSCTFTGISLFKAIKIDCVFVASAHLGLYTSDIGWGQWVNIIHETVCRQWFGVG